MKKALLVLVLLALLCIRASAQETAPTFSPEVETFQINAVLTFYRITDGKVVCYWMDGDRESGLSCLFVEKDAPPLSAQFLPIVNK